MIQVFAAGFSSLCFGVVFQVRGRKKLLFAGLGGGLGYLVYLLILPYSQVTAVFFASCAITAYSEVMARVVKSPATIFLVAGLIPIVPGRGMYQCMYQALEGNLYEAATTCYQTLLVAGAIAIGVVAVTSLIRMASARRKLRRSR